MNKYDVIIGIEIHIQMKTKSKMFSSAPSSFGREVNKEVDLYDFAFPGTLPTVNKEAVINAIRLANALHMKIDDVLMFERKNYFYSDLPKGYQLTQQFRPLGKDGYLSIGDRNIKIERLHIEEDTCKQVHLFDHSLLDYNRAGIPLVEVVSRPDIKTAEEAAQYVEHIKSIVSFLGVSEGKMEEGSLRCDINISLKNKNQNELGTKVEIKNLNSISNIKKAINYEINRQSELLDNGQLIKQETRRYDEANKKTVLMRIKIDEIDYKCFTDPNIPPIHLSKEFIDNAISSSPELADSKKARYISLGLSEYDASLLVSSKEVSDYFDKLISNNVNPKSAANWINGEIQSYLNKIDTSISDFKIKPERMAELLILVETNKISIKQAREIFATMLDDDRNLEEIIIEKGLIQNNDEEDLKQTISRILNNNPKAIKDYKNGYDKAIGYLMGQVMKETKGNANPSLANKIIIEEISWR